MRHIIKSNISTMNIKGVVAGMTAVGTIFQPLRSTAVPGSGDKNAMSKAAAISRSLNAPRFLIKFISYKIPL
jgi:hypothetical protein